MPYPWPHDRWSAPTASPQEVLIERERLRRIRDALPDAAGPLAEAAALITGLGVAESAFTSFTYSLAVAYGEVEAFTLRELRNQAEDTVLIGELVDASEATWGAAEHASTVAAL